MTRDPELKTQTQRILARLDAGERAVDIARSLNRSAAYVRQTAYKARNPVRKSSGRRPRGAATDRVMERAEAVALGLPSYFTGRPCARGHVASRTTVNSTCTICANEAAATRRARDLSATRAKRRAYYWAHVEIERAQSRSAYRKFRIARIADKAQWQLENRERHNETVRRWVAANPGAVNARTARRRAGIGQATPAWLTTEDHAAMRALYAEARRWGKHVDHIIPLKGETVCGLHVPWNLQLLSQSENSKKWNRL